ncbi:MAG: hypothetical protein JKY67_03675 [Pseudomonadales bacterium]|nr:hypothetical protein [Pseudomonadales bacterium]
MQDLHDLRIIIESKIPIVIIETYEEPRVGLLRQINYRENIVMREHDKVTEEN